MSHTELDPNAAESPPGGDLRLVPEVEMDRRETTKEVCKYYFSEAEKKELSEMMARSLQEIKVAEAELDTIKAQYKHRITSATGTASACSEKIIAGYEMRTMECYVVRDHETKMIRIYRMDNDELIRQRAMTKEDLQRRLPS